MEDSKLNRIVDILKAADRDTVTPQDLVIVISRVVALFADLDEQTKTQLQSMTDLCVEMQKEYEKADTENKDSIQTGIKVVRDEIMAVVEKYQTSCNQYADKAVETAKKEIKVDFDNLDATVTTLSKAVDDLCAEEDDEETEYDPIQIRNSLETLLDDDRLPISAIDGLQEALSKLSSRGGNGSGFQLFGGASGIQLYTNGTKRGTAKYINFIPGTGISITYVNTNGRHDLTFAMSGSGGFTRLTATGTIDGNNKAFTFTQKPTYIIMDGAWMQQNKGWTWSAGPLTATMDVPPQNDIYGFI